MGVFTITIFNLAWILSKYTKTLNNCIKEGRWIELMIQPEVEWIWCYGFRLETWIKEWDGLEVDSYSVHNSGAFIARFWKVILILGMNMNIDR